MYKYAVLGLEVRNITTSIFMNICSLYYYHFNGGYIHHYRSTLSFKFTAINYV